MSGTGTGGYLGAGVFLGAVFALEDLQSFNILGGNCEPHKYILLETHFPTSLPVSLLLGYITQQEGRHNRRETGAGRDSTLSTCG